MKPPPDLPELRILEVAALHPHERMDEDRAAPLAQAIRAEGVLRNPPVVLPFEDGTPRYVVLDGANRTVAFRQLGLAHIAAQVVHRGRGSIRVETWNHIVMGGALESVLEALRCVESIELMEATTEGARLALEGGEALAYVLGPEGRIVVLQTPPATLVARVELLDAVVGSYHPRWPLERTSEATTSGLKSVFDSFACLVVFPTFHVEDILHVVAAGGLLPTGITRFIISPRALHLNFPLSQLEAPRSIEHKQSQLDRWIAKALRDRRIRFYAEPTFLFDE